MMIAIEPHVAIGPLRFGMGQEAVIASLGKPQLITKNHFGNSELWYGHMNVIMDGDHLVEVGFAPDVPVSILGMHPFADQNAFAKLCEIDGSPYEVLGFIVLRNLGITLTGFHDGDESQKAMTAFAPGRWEGLEPQMKPFHVKAA